MSNPNTQSAARILGPYVVGEVPDEYQHAFYDSAGDALDLAGYTGELRALKPDHTYVTVPATQVSGNVVTVAAPPFDLAGTWHMEIVATGEFTYVSNRYYAAVSAALVSP